VRLNPGSPPSVGTQAIGAENEKFHAQYPGLKVLSYTVEYKNLQIEDGLACEWSGVNTRFYPCQRFWADDGQTGNIEPVPQGTGSNRRWKGSDDYRSSLNRTTPIARRKPDRHGRRSRCWLGKRTDSSLFSQCDNGVARAPHRFRRWAA